MVAHSLVQVFAQTILSQETSHQPTKAARCHFVLSNRGLEYKYAHPDV